jgi:hypothetical protein
VGLDQKETPQLRAAFSLYQARRHRHHKHCHCRSFHGEGCNASDALWTRAMDRELEQMLK